MSVHYTAPVWRLVLPTVPKIVLLKFGDNANDDGYAWPAIGRVARECGLSERSVQRHVATFRRDGVLVPLKGATGGRRGGGDPGEPEGNTCRYWIDLERAKDLYRRQGAGFGAGGPATGEENADKGLDGNGETDLSTAKGDSVSPLAAKGDSDDVKGDSDDVKGDSDDIASIEEPSTEPSTEPARARGGGAVADTPASRPGDAGGAKGSGTEAGEAEASETGAARKPWEGLGPGRLQAAVAAVRAERGGAVRLGTISERERAAAEALLAAVAAGEAEDPHGLAAAHASDVLRAHAERLREVIGDRAYRAWVLELTPVEDDGETLTVAAPSKHIAEWVKANLGADIEDVIDRRLAVTVTTYAGPAAKRRVAAGGWAGEAAAAAGGPAGREAAAGAKGGRR